MKKLVSLLLVLLLIGSVALVACDNTDDPNYNDDLAFNDDPTNGENNENNENNNNENNNNENNNNENNNNQYTFTDVEETVYVQNCVQVNIRTTPDASSKDNLAGVVDFGQEFKRVKYNEMWSGIEVDGEIFYLNTYFLVDKPNEVVFTDTTKTIYATNIDPNNGDKGTVYLRTFTSTSPDPEFYPDGNVGAVAKHGAPLQVTGLSTDGKWYRVDFTYTEEDGTTKTVKNLYVYNGKYVTETNPIEETPAE